MCFLLSSTTLVASSNVIMILCVTFISYHTVLMMKIKPYTRTVYSGYKCLTVIVTFKIEVPGVFRGVFEGPETLQCILLLANLILEANFCFFQISANFLMIWLRE